jgi:hypothetical protein
MWISKRVLLAAAIVSAAAMSLMGAVGAFGDRGSGHHGGGHQGSTLVEEMLAPSVPTDPTFHGVAPGAAPWVLKRGALELKRSRLELEVRGLVIPNPPGDGTPGPVTTISASLYCGADSDTTAADTTPQVPITRRGNARIRDRSFTVPATCLAPLILVHPNGDADRAFATGIFVSLASIRSGASSSSGRAPDF